MSDLISRQAAIDALYKMLHDCFWADDEELDAVITTLNDLPSAQPEREDAVSRKAVLQRLTDISYNHCKTEGEAEAIGLAKTMVSVMPSVQPDIIRCRDCKYFEYDHLYVVQNIPVIGHLVCNKWGNGCRTDENGFCFMAERRTDEQTKD